MCSLSASRSVWDGVWCVAYDVGRVYAVCCLLGGTCSVVLVGWYRIQGQARVFVRVCVRAHTHLSKFILELAGKFEVVIRLHRWFLRIVYVYVCVSACVCGRA